MGAETHMGTFDSRCFLSSRKRAKQGANTAGVVGLLFVLIVVGFSPLAIAVPYFGDEVFTYHQPDGSTFGVRLYGDEFFAYQRTADEGREVVKDESTGFWCYAKLSADGRSFVSTGVPVVTAAKDTATAQAQPLPSSAAEPFATLPLDAALASAKERKEELAALGREYLAAGGSIRLAGTVWTD